MTPRPPGPPAIGLDYDMLSDRWLNELAEVAGQTYLRLAHNGVEYARSEAVRDLLREADYLGHKGSDGAGQEAATEPEMVP